MTKGYVKNVYAGNGISFVRAAAVCTKSKKKKVCHSERTAGVWLKTSLTQSRLPGSKLSRSIFEHIE